MESREHEREGQPEQAAPAMGSESAAPAPGQAGLRVVSMLGNQAFAALARSHTPGATGRGPRVVAGPVVARENGHGDQGAGAATAQPSPTEPSPTPWTPPLSLPPARTHAEAVLDLIEMEQAAEDVVRAGYTFQLEDLLPEMRAHRQTLARDHSAPLTVFEVAQLEGLTRDFTPAYDISFGQMRSDLRRQLEGWQNPPLTEDEVFDLREAVHERFIRGDEAAISQLTEFLESIEEVTGQIDDWIGYGHELQEQIRGASNVARLREVFQGLHERVERATRYVSLVNGAGRLARLVGEGPAGEDVVARVEGALAVTDFIAGRFEIPVLSQLWENYILEGARAALAGVRHVLRTYYATERGGTVQNFFLEHRGDARAPNIQEAGSRFGNVGEHFPGGQPVLDFMWQVMRDEPPASVPREVEDYFVRFRSQFNAGMGRGNQIETDSSWTNLWNLLTRAESPNLLRWVRENRYEVWTRLYGGMPPPQA